MNMKHTMKWIGILIATSIALVACDGSGSVKTEKVWRLVEEVAFDGETTTREYDGSGRVIKQINSQYGGSHYEFNYDDKGELISRDDFNSAGKLRFRNEFDSHGEMVSRSVPDASGAFVSTTIFINTYDDNRVVSDKATKRPYGSNLYTVYPSSKMVTREEVSPASFARYTYEGDNKVAIKYFDTSTDSTVTAEVEEEYNEQGDLVRRLLDTDGAGPKPAGILLYDYTYTIDGNGNLSERVRNLSGANRTTTYKWEPMDIPVQ